MEVTGHVVMTRALLSPMLRAALRRRFVRYRIAGIMLIAAGVLTIWTEPQRLSFAVGPLAAGLAAALLPELTMALGFRKLRLGDGQVWAYRLSPAGARQTNPVAEVTIGWQTVKEVTETAGAWLLRLRTGGVFMVPKAAFEPPEHRRVADLLAAQGLTPAGREK